MATSPVSAGLQALLAQQKREAEYLKQQHNADWTRQQQQWQQRALWQRQQQQAQQQRLRFDQQNHREMLAAWAKMNPTAYVGNIVKSMKALGAFVKFSQKEQQVLEKAAQQGKLGKDLKILFEQQHRKELRQQQTHQQQQRLDTRQQQRQQERTLQASIGQSNLSLRQRHGEERTGAREQEQENRDRQRRQQRRQRDQARRGQVRRGHLKQAGLSLAGGNVGGVLTHGIGALAGGGAAGIAAAIYEGVKAAAQTTTALTNIHSNTSLTSGQKQDLTARQFGLGWMVDFRDSVSGITERLRQLGLATEITGLQIRQWGERTSAIAAGQAQQRLQQYRVAPLREQAAPAIQKAGDALAAIDRRTYQGERQYQFEQIRFAPRVSLARSEAAVQAAEKSHEEAQRFTAGRRKHLLESQVRLANWEKERQRLRADDTHRGPANAGNKEELERANKGAGLATEEVLRNEKLLREAINREQSMGVSLAEKQNQIERARTAMLKAEVEVLRQKEQTQAHGAQAVGRMTLAQRAQAGIALKMLQRGMPLHLMPQAMRGALESVAPQAMQKRFEQAGLGTKLYKQFQKEGLIDKGDLNEIRKERTKLETQVEVKVTLDEAMLAEKIAEKLGKALEDLVKAITARQEAEMERLKRGQHERNAGGA